MLAESENHAARSFGPRFWSLTYSSVDRKCIVGQGFASLTMTSYQVHLARCALAPTCSPLIQLKRHAFAFTSTFALAIAYQLPRDNC